MGQKQSKDELVFQQVSLGNTEAIKALRREGAGLEWVDKEGKTPLILASMNAELFNVAKTLIDLGSNVDAFRPGRNGGTPLHHAARRGLENTVKLLLSHHANPLVMNDDYQTPLEISRAKGFCNVVRAIESHICLFSGWMREFYGPSFLDLFAPQLLSRRVWVVIVPMGSRNPTKPFKLELAVYASLQDAKPKTVMALWKANLEEPKSYQSDTSIMIVDNSATPRGRKARRRACGSKKRCRPQADKQTRIKLASAIEGDRQQLNWFSDACKGIPQPLNPPMFLQTSQATLPSEDVEIAMAINLSLQSPMNQMPNIITHQSIDQAGPSTSTSIPPHLPRKVVSSIDFTAQEPSAPPLPNNIALEDAPASAPAPAPASAPAPVPVPVPVLYPSIDSILPSLDCENGGDKGSGGVCSICLDAACEAVCVPCGHVAGCVSCLTEIKGKKWGCPVCRANIDQVIKLYRV